VVGLDFHQTDPQFLKRFRPWARVHETGDGTTFHPKIYVFRHGRRFDAILGSSNLTRGGFGGNVEANVHLHGSTDDGTFIQLTRFIEDLAGRGLQMSTEEIDRYEREWRRRHPEIERARKFKPSAPRRPSSGSVSLHVDWPAFVRGMQRAASSTGHHIYPRRGESLGYLGVVEEVQGLFRRHRRLSSMSEAQRQKVAGLLSGYGYFGWMRGAGLFAHYVNNEPARLDAALDRIPARPSSIGPAQFDAFVRTITRTKGLGRPAVGSRLLAMKRPDVFLCLDSENRAGLAESFGFTPSELNTYEGYLALHEVLWQCPWHKSPRPKDRSNRIWDARVALVDAFFYGAS
jgi:hypothetical protein